MFVHCQHFRQTIIAANTIDNCHDLGGDSQCILGYNGTKELLIQNNTLQGGHEIILWGGADPADSSQTPQDIVTRGNYIYRPLSWKNAVGGSGNYAAGQWPVKNWIESKNVKRWLIENNIFENDWSDAQQFGFNFKSENQNCSASYTQSADITMRYNRMRVAENGWSLSGKQGDCASVTMARINIHDNWFESGFNTNAPVIGEGWINQMLNGVVDLIFAHNTVRNSGASEGIAKVDGAPMVRASIHSNAFYVGSYGIKGTGQSSGTNTINTYMPGGLYSHNIMIGADCGSYPASNICPSSWPVASSLGYDQRAIGADTIGVKNKTAGIVAQ